MAVGQGPRLGTYLWCEQVMSGLHIALPCLYDRLNTRLNTDMTDFILYPFSVVAYSLQYSWRL